jgi:hypothetical protein
MLWKSGRWVEDKKSSSTSKTLVYKGISKERWKVEEKTKLFSFASIWVKIPIPFYPAI